jgi:uncharacterized protein YsxB (DUF464 family)
MIKILVTSLHDEIQELLVQGHASMKHNLEIEHLICSAVSSVVTGGFNAIKDDEVKLELRDGYARLQSSGSLSEHDKVVVETMIIQLQTIKNSYPKHLRIIKKGE